MVAPRDYSEMIRDGRCAVCGCGTGGVSYVWGDHIEAHLAAGEAVVIMERGKADRVVPK